MKRKDYQKPSMRVFELKQQCRILAGSVASTGSAGVQDYNWNTPAEE